MESRLVTSTYEIYQQKKYQIYKIFSHLAYNSYIKSHTFQCTICSKYSYPREATRQMKHFDSIIVSDETKKCEPGVKIE